MEQFMKIIEKEPLVLVDFYATWCGPCKAMHSVLEQVKKQMGGSICILKIDVDKNIPVVNHFNVQSMPTFILFQNGKNVWRHSGALSLSALMQNINVFGIQRIEKIDVEPKINEVCQ